MKILVLNCGSSSVKYSLFDMATESILANGIVEEIGLNIPSMTHRRPGHDKLTWDNIPVTNHREAIARVLDTLLHPDYGVIHDLREIHAVGHRVVHGGEKFAQSVIIDDEVLNAIRDNVELAPLHNPAAIQGIEAMRSLLPATPQVAVFDTAFHQTMPPEAYLYAIPYQYYRKYRIRRYGFHGTSHRYVAQQAARYLGRPITELKIVTCHLGNGASITAVDGGKSVDTSMGFTPLAGLPMGTRCGDIDPAIVIYLMEKEGLDTAGINEVLNKRSGMLGLSELSSDMRVFEEALHAGPSHPNYERSMLVLKLYTRQFKKYIGAYAAAMGGLDCIVFTGGIGENFKEVSEWACQGLEFLGVKGVQSRRASGQIVEASAPDSRVKVLIIPTNEELAIARDTAALVNNHT
ncbi:MAG: acetate/propionate family kinase [Anaerolineae bacterium]